MGSIHNLKLLGSELCALMDNFSTFKCMYFKKDSRFANKARFTDQLIKFSRESINFCKLCVAVCRDCFSGNPTLIEHENESAVHPSDIRSTATYSLINLFCKMKQLALPVRFLEADHTVCTLFLPESSTEMQGL